MKFIIKLFPEITIKSKPVRQRLVKQLRQNVQVVLTRQFEGVKVQGFWDKVEVRLAAEFEHQGDAVAEALQRIPGIANILRVQSYQIADIDNNFEEILKLCAQSYREVLRGKRFVVRVKRTGDHRFTSHELERFIGGGLLRETEAAGVDLTKPDYTVKLEVRNDEVYLVEDRFEGLGG
ncbi:MAG: THUMP domain-containing protein, partial [Oleiphilaceae bacterium]|nr:THUMP domain-containing protein [Oleiphilaceae bacterium]